MAVVQAMRRWQRGAVARRSDPDTSHEAAKSLPAAVLNIRQAAIGAALAFNGGRGTDEQIADLYHGMENAPWQSPSSLRTRRNELVKMGVVRDTGERIANRRGNNVVVWELVAERECEYRGEHADG